MTKKNLYALWGGLFILCAGLGFIPEPEGATAYVLTGVSLIFFVPPVLLILKGDRDTLALVRNLSAMSLGLTLVLLIANFLCAPRSQLVGTVLHLILTVVSAPMIVSQRWAMSMFLWACLLFGSMKKLRHK